MPLNTITATIPAGQSLSNAIDCRSGAPILLFLPMELTPAPRLTFAISHDGVVYHDYFDRTAKEIAINIAPGTVLKMDSEWTASALGGYLRLRLGSRENPMAQAQDRVFLVTIDTGK